MHVDPFDDERPTRGVPCSNIATNLVDGMLRCDIHTPAIETLTPERAESLEDDLIFDAVARARPYRRRRGSGRPFLMPWGDTYGEEDDFDDPENWGDMFARFR